MTHPEHPWIETTFAPVYVLTYPEHDPELPEQVSRYIAEQVTVFEVLRKWTAFRCSPFAFVVDLTHLQVSTALGRQRATAYLEHSRERGNPFSVCRAFVVSGEIQRILTAVFWQSAPDYPHIVVPTRQAALEWVQTKMRSTATG